MKSSVWSIAALCLSLAGCSSIAPSTRPTVPADLLQPCPPIDKRPVADLGELLQFTTDIVGAYGECAARQRKLAEAVGSAAK